MRDSARRLAKQLANGLALVIVSPCAFLAWVETRLTANGEGMFGFWTNVMAVLPGLPGLYLRRAFYHLTLDCCSLDCYIGFGALITHRRVTVEDDVFVGPYAIVGCARLRRGVLLGSRVSILSGPALHSLDDRGNWQSADLAQLVPVEIGEHAWIGEGAIVMVGVGAGSLVGAGAVVSMRVRPNVVVAGNPARFVRRLKAEPRDTRDGVVEGGANVT